MQVVLLPLAWPGAVKFPIVATVAIALSLLSYEFIVRRSLVGEIINGARKRTTRRGRLGPEFGWMATLGVIGVLSSPAGPVFARLPLPGTTSTKRSPAELYPQCPALVGGPRGDDPPQGAADRGHLHRRQRPASLVRGPEADLPGPGVELYPFNLRRRSVPDPRDAAASCSTSSSECPRPILVQGNRGIDQSGFAAAVAQLLAGESAATWPCGNSA